MNTPVEEKNKSMRHTFIVSEMACAHEGDLDIAKSLVDASALASADAVQLQIWEADAMMSPQRPEYELLKRIEFSQEQWQELVFYSRIQYPELKVYACVYEHQSIEFINSLDVDGFKTNSSDLSNPLVLTELAKTNKPINLSVGASSLSEISNALFLLSELPAGPISLMYGHQNFPTKPEDINLSYIPTLMNLFKLPVGYQDHCAGDSPDGFYLPAAAAGYGASLQEKHITHDRSKKGIDHQSALNPDEFSDFVKMIRALDVAKGCSTPKPFSESEKSYREFQKKSVVLNKSMSAGTIIEKDDVAFMRAEHLGISPADVDRVVGRQLRVNLEAFVPISNDDLA